MRLGCIISMWNLCVRVEVLVSCLYVCMVRSSFCAHVHPEPFSCFRAYLLGYVRVFYFMMTVAAHMAISD